MHEQFLFLCIRRQWSCPIYVYTLPDFNFDSALLLLFLLLVDGSKLGFTMVGDFYCAQGLGTQIICVHDELQRVFVMQVDLENGQPGLSETALIAFGLVAFNSITSFDGGGDAASSEADVAEVAGEIAAEVLARLDVVPKKEGEDTSSSAGICSRQKHVMIASALLASIITGIFGSCVYEGCWC